MPDETTLPPGAATPAGMLLQVGRYRIEPPNSAKAAWARSISRTIRNWIGPSPSSFAAYATIPAFSAGSRAVAALRHPNNCPIYDLGEERGQPFLCMAFIRGETLAARLIRLGTPTVEESIPLVRASLWRCKKLTSTTSCIAI